MRAAFERAKEADGTTKESSRMCMRNEKGDKCSEHKRTLAFVRIFSTFDNGAARDKLCRPRLC